MCHSDLSARRAASLSLWVLATAFQALLAVAAMPAQDAGGPKVDTAVIEEYRRRLSELGARDIAGHYALAQWCNEQKQYQLVIERTQYLLELDPRNVDARLLNTAALHKLGQQPVDSSAAGRVPGEIALGLITKQDIQRLRFVELLDFQTDDVPPALRESISVRFDRGTLTAFLDAMGDAPEFVGKANRQRFIALKPTQQVQVMRQYGDLAYQPKIRILNDPLVFRKFKPVAALIERGCATRDCHGGGTPAKPFGWRGHLLYPEQSLYTQFLILDRVAVGRDRLIDRDQPADSLILVYGLPPGATRRTHPGQIKPLYAQGTQDPNYRMVLEWIDLLRIPRPINGIRVEGYPEPPPPGSRLSASKEPSTRPSR